MEQSKPLLPRVADDTYDSVAQSIFEASDSDGEFVEQYGKHLLKHNPTVLAFMEFWIRKLKPRELMHTYIGMLVVYKLLESQAEANQLEEEFNVEAK